MANRNRKGGDLQVWWIPQVPMKAFEVDVRSLREARLILDTLARYDQFQFDNNIKPDYSNVGGLRVWNADESEWWDWDDPETGESFDDISDERLAELDAATVAEEVL